MSSGGVSAERAAPWRRSSAQGNPRQQSSSGRTASGSNTPQDRANTPSKAANDAGNRGQGQNAQKSGASGALRRDNGAGLAGNATKSAQSQPQSSSAPSVDGAVHVPVNGFNADDIRNFMKKAYAQAVADAGGDEKSLQVKVIETGQPKKAAPWAARPNQMASGQNFFLELSKQIKAQEDAGQKSDAQSEQSRKGN